MHPQVINALRRDWQVKSRSAHAGLVLERLVRREPELAALGAVSLTELFESLSSSSANAAEKPWRITVALLRSFDLDELVGLGLLVALVPGMLNLGRRLDWGLGGPWDDAECFCAELLATTWQVLRDLAPAPPPYPERVLLSRVRARLAHERVAAKRRSLREVELADGPELADTRVEQSLSGVLGVLKDLARGGLDADELRLVFLHGVAGYSMRELAARDGVDRKHLEYRRRMVNRRLEAVLCAS